MKKYILLAVLFTLFGLAACYDDDSRLATGEIGDIAIDTLKDASIISYSGNKLEREPKIEIKVFGRTVGLRLVYL